MGRQSKYSQKMADMICGFIASGHSERSICEMEGMPDRTTLRAWRDANPDFASKCARAREDQAEHHHAEMDDIEEKVLDGRLDPKAANVVLVNKRWRMEKLDRGRYGNKVSQEISGPNGGPIQHQAVGELTDEQLMAIAANAAGNSPK